MLPRLTLPLLHDILGIAKGTPGYGTSFGPLSRQKFNALITNKKAPALTEADYQKAANTLKVPVKHMKGVRKVEAPRGAYDDEGRPTILFERHKFRNNTVPVGRFNKTHPLLSGPAYGPGGYGSFSSQYEKLFDAMALDPQAALMACSWGAFQVLGENYEDMGYESVLEMVLSLAESEAGHLDTFVRYIIANGLEDELRACKPNNPASCVPLVSKYNGPNHAQFNYAPKLAAAIA